MAQTFNNGESYASIRAKLNTNAKEIDINNAKIGLTDGDKGDITVSGDGTTWTVDNEAITFAKMQNISQNHFIGKHTAGSGTPEMLSATQARGILNVEDGATADQTDAEIATAYGNQVPQVSAGEITAGTETALRTYSPADVKAFVDEHGGGGSGSITTFDKLEVSGTMYTGVISSFRALQGGTMAKFSTYLETAPTGANFITVLKINGTTQATATITAGTTSGTTTSFTSSTLTEGDLVTYEITQIGSTVAGSDLTVGLTLS